MDKALMRELVKAKKNVKLMREQYGPSSKQYKDAIKHQAALVIKQLTGK